MTFEVRQGDCVELMAAMPAGSVDAVVCDPPYGLEFMGKDWDSLQAKGRAAKVRERRAAEVTPDGIGHTTSKGPYLAAGVDWQGVNQSAMQEWHQAWATEALRVLKPGSHLLAMGGPRTIHRLVCAVEDAGFEIRDMLSWNFGSGFPKSRNVTDDLKAVVPVRERCACAHRSSQTPEGSPGDCPAYPRSGDGPPPPASDNGQAAPPSPADAPACSHDDLLVDGPAEAPASTSLGGASDHPASVGFAHRSADRQSDSLASGSSPSGTASSTSPDGQTEPHRTDGRTPDTSSSASDSASSSRSRYENLPRCPDCQGVVIPEGIGTALKPAWEGITVARKPLSGTVSACVLEHGTGALNVDGCRVGTGEDKGQWPVTERSTSSPSMVTPMAHVETRTEVGRWPANVVLSHTAAGPPLYACQRNNALYANQCDDCPGCPLVEQPGCVQVGTRKVKGHKGYPKGPGGTDTGVAWSSEEVSSTLHERTEPWAGHPDTEAPAYRCTPDCPVRLLDEQTGELHSQDPATRRSYSKREGSGFTLTKAPGAESAGFGDSGGASRFFYVAKASRGERNAGLEGFEEQDAWRTTGEGLGLRREPGELSSTDEPTQRQPTRNGHPTVKPISLMRWLVRLVTPPGGTVLDPFAGSGTTGCACALEGFDFIGLEREPEYVAIAEARIAWWHKHRGDGEAAQILAAGEARDSVEATGQLGMFD